MLFIPSVDKKVSCVFPQKVEIFDPLAYALAFPLQPLICSRSCFQGLWFWVMNHKFFCAEKPPSQAHVRWASPGCGVRVASLRYGPLSSRAGRWIWPAYTPYETFNHSLVHHVLKSSSLTRRKQKFVCDLMSVSSTIWKMTSRLSSSGNPGNGRSCFC